MLDVAPPSWGPPQPPLFPGVRRAVWQPPLTYLAVQPSGGPLPPPSASLPPPPTTVAEPVAPLTLGDSSNALPPPSLAPPAFHPDALPPPTGQPVEPDETPRRGGGRRGLIAGAVAAAVVLGMVLVGVGAFDSSDQSAPPDVPSRTPAVDEPEVATPSGEPSSGPVPATPPRPSTTTEVDDSDADDTSTGEPATEPPSLPPAEPVSPRAGDAATAEPPSAPLPLRTAAPIGDRYVVTMAAVDLDATELIVAEDPANQPPAAGDIYVMITLDVEFSRLVGEAEPYFDLLVGATDDDGREFDDIGCVAFTPGDMYDAPPIGPGETLTGTFCLVVPAATADSLTFFVEETRSAAELACGGRPTADPESGRLDDVGQRTESGRPMTVI